jgi:hypothetical protein
MGDKIRRVRCGTKRCTGFIDTNVSTMPKSAEGNWQFHCNVCGFWSLLSETGMLKATSRDEFDLQRLPTSLRAPFPVTRGPAGGI